MKIKYLLPPLLALAITGTWLGARHRTMTILEEETILLRQHVDAAKYQMEGGGSSGSMAKAGDGVGAESEAIDWKDLAESLAGMERGGLPDMRKLVEIQTKLMALEELELIAALDELANLDLTTTARQRLESMLVPLLAAKNPNLALDRYIGGVNDSSNSLSWQLSHIFQQWAEKDESAALAWFDRQIDAGTFDGKSLDGAVMDGRLKFEAVAIARLLAKDISAARERIEALTEDQRRGLFRSGMAASGEGSKATYASLVREYLPEEERGEALAAGLRGGREDGYEKAGEYLREIEATASERSEIVKRAARNQMQMLEHGGTIDRKAVDEMRDWLGKEAPDEADRAMGEALANVWGQNSSWEERAGLIGELHTESASDDLLVAFLGGNQARQHREAALELAAKISDESERAQIIEKIEGRAPTSN